MPFCQSCGAEHSDDARFCPKCGKGLGAAAGSVAPAAGSEPPAPPPPIDVGASASTAPPVAPIDTPASPPPPPPTPFSTPPPAPLSLGNDAPSGPAPKSMAGLTTALTVLLIIGVVVSIVGAGLTFSAAADANALVDSDDGFFADLLNAEDANNKVGGAVLLWGTLAIAILVLLIIWTHRGHKNLKAFGVTNPMLPTGMAIGSWFIPLFWYLGPYWCISDSYKGAAPDAATNPSWRQSGGLLVALLWWIAFCVGNMLFWVGSAAATNDANSSYSFGDDTSAESILDIAENPDRYATGWTIVGVGFLAATAAGILGAMAVRAIGARQQERILASPAS